MTFVDAPFAPRHIAVIYSAQEDVTVVRWRMSATANDPGVGFELLDPAGTWRTIDFAASIYPGGVAPCGTGGGLCAQTVLAGHYQPPAHALTPVRSRNPTFGTSPGDAATVQKLDKSLVLQSHFLRGNAMLGTTIGDAIGGDAVFAFPRALERATWERPGVCVSGYRPADTRFDPVDGLKKPWPAPAPLSAAGRYCASVRAVMSNGDRGTDEPVAIDTLPEVTYGDHTYTVPTERTPFSYQIVLDLSIPVADRCQEATEKIQTLVAKTFGGYSSLRTFPVLDLSAEIDPETHAPGTPCRQSPLRALDSADVAQQIKLAAASWTEQHQRFFLIYFNNLRAPLPDSLIQSLYDFRSTVVTPPPVVDFQALVWAFGPGEMSQSFGGWDMPSQDWISATDPVFVGQLVQFASQSLPLVSEIQDPNQPVEILKPGQAGPLDGGLLRLCQISITPLQDTGLQLVQHDADGNLIYLPRSATETPVHGDDPPAYLLYVPPVWAVSNVGFSPHRSHIRFEVCTRYCDHSFVAESGVQVTNGWIGNALCMGQE